jgi:hypothetical protein
MVGGAYGIPAAEVSRYDLDHLIPLNAGGASDVRSLWPIRNARDQFPAATAYHNDKAVVEYYVFTAMCQRRTTPSAVRGHGHRLDHGGRPAGPPAGTREPPGLSGAAAIA